MKKILFVVNVDWFFESHRLEIAKRAISEGYEVHLACKNTGRFQYFESLGFLTHHLELGRSNTGIIHNCKNLIKLYLVIKKINPNICHFITIKPIVFGGIISLFNSKTKSVYSITGLGSSFLSEVLHRRVRSYIIAKFYSFTFKKKNSIAIFQNTSDLTHIFPNYKNNFSKFKLIYGSGVDLKLFKEKTKDFDNELNVVMASRALRDKGVREFFEAACILKKKYNDKLNFYFYGEPDPENPTSISFDQLNDLNKNNAVRVCGFSNKMHEVLNFAHILVLPSYREGFPKIVMEGSACGCISIVSNVPGCRDAILDGKTGFLVKQKSPQSIVESIEHCLLSRDNLPAMSKFARKHAEENFSISKIVEQHFELYAEF